MNTVWSAAISQTPTIHYFDPDHVFSHEKLDAESLSGGMKFFHRNPKGRRVVARPLKRFLETKRLL